MRSTSLLRLGLILGLALLTACGGDDEIRSPLDDDLGGDSPGGGGDGGGSGGGDSAGDGSGSGTVKIGSGTGTSFVPGVLTASMPNLPAGGSTDIVVNLVDGANVAISDEIAVGFASDCVSNALASFNETTVSTVAGRASVKYTAAGCTGTDTVTATALIDGTTIQASVDLTVQADRVTALEFVSANPEQLSLRGMGGVENSQVSFQLVGEQGTPIRGEAVTFSINNTTGGIRLTPDNDGNPATETVNSDNDGVATITVRSGTVADVVRVTASYDGGRIQSTSGDLVISTGVPVFDGFSLSYTPMAPPGASGTDGIEVEIQVIASDQFGNDAFDGTRIRFWSRESGNIDSSCELVSGRCTATWISASPRPTDGRVTFIAFTNGAENFTDVNGNYAYDPGEDWTDISEAYADHNENGQYDPGEPFVDIRGADNTWDSKVDVGGTWDGRPCAGETCPGLESVTVWRNGVIILANTWYPDVFRLGPPDAGGCPTREPLDFSPISLATNSYVLPAFFVSDGTDPGSLPCHVIGNPMSAGTTITFSTNNGNIVGTDSWTVPANVTDAMSVGPLTLEADDESSVGTLILTITPPEDDVPPTVHTWEVSD